MTMTAAGLQAAIVGQLGSADDSAKRDAFALALATAIINYLKSNALVSVTTTGSATAQSGTGTIT